MPAATPVVSEIGSIAVRRVEPPWPPRPLWAHPWHSEIPSWHPRQRLPWPPSWRPLRCNSSFLNPWFAARNPCRAARNPSPVVLLAHPCNTTRAKTGTCLAITWGARSSANADRLQLLMKVTWFLGLKHLWTRIPRTPIPVLLGRTKREEPRLMCARRPENTPSNSPTTGPTDTYTKRCLPLR